MRVFHVEHSGSNTGDKKRKASKRAVNETQQNGPQPNNGRWIAEGNSEGMNQVNQRAQPSGTWNKGILGWRAMEKSDH